MVLGTQLHVTYGMHFLPCVPLPSPCLFAQRLGTVWPLAYRGHLPFPCLVQGELDFESDPWPKISREAKDCVRKMLESVRRAIV